MTKAEELLNELNAHKTEDLHRDAGRIKAILTILDVVEHEILEESRNDYAIISNKYNKLLDTLRKSALKQIEPTFDLIAMSNKNEVFYVDDVLYNNYIINDIYGIFRILDNSNIVDIFVSGYENKQDIREMKIFKLVKGE